MAAKGVQRYSERDMIRALQRIAQRLGRTPMADSKHHGSSYPEFKRKSEPSAAVLMYHFGSWNKALEAAGLPLNSRQPGTRCGFGVKTWTDEELLQAVRTAARQVERLTCMAYEELRPEDSPCCAIIRRRLRTSVGTWAEIVAAVGGQSGTANLPKKPIKPKR